MKVKKTDLPVMAPESEILPAGGDLDDMQDEDDDDIEDDEVGRTIMASVAPAGGLN